MTAFTSGRDEPERNLRNLGEPWEPLRTGAASGAGAGAGGGVGSGTGTAYGTYPPEPGGRTCTDPGRDVYVPPPAARTGIGEQSREPSERAEVGRRETGRGIPRKSRAVYAVITDFSLQLQRSEKPGTELGVDRQRRCRTPMPLDRRGRSHTKWRDMPAAPVPVRLALAPVPASWAAAARERPRSGACHGAPSSRRCQRSAALRVAGTWAMSAQRWHTPALGALAL
uniref:Uncharacterized protein n=1 Tax=Phage sp. ct4bw6 TaxID=2826747 RepID=A0A8S5MUC8_9VIRU|nr:MAG TPA: hypothetical protein [Phage sp. ct4bw6]